MLRSLNFVKSFSTKKVAAKFPGASGSHFTQTLSFKSNYKAIDTYQVLDQTGVPASPVPSSLTKDVLVKMYKNMITLNTMDLILYEAQRQGRISFYMTSYGEEG